MYKLIPATLLLITFTCTAPAQNVFVAMHDDGFHVVERVADQSFIILLDAEEVKLPAASTTVFLRDMPEFLPGYLEIEGEHKVETKGDDQNRTYADMVYWRYTATVTPNRDLTHPYLVLRWLREDKKAAVVAFPLDDFVAGEPQTISVKTFVNERYTLIDPSAHYMGMGYELGTSREMDEPQTPYAYALDKAGGGSLPDGNIKPLRMLPNPVVEDPEGNPIKGTVHMLMRVDDKGYVSSFEVKKYTDWKLAKAAVMNAPFFFFQPKIENGQPVDTGFILPFRF